MSHAVFASVFRFPPLPASRPAPSQPPTQTMDALASLLGSSSPKHPYSPAGLALQGYAPIGRSLASVLVPFFGVAGAVTAGAWAWAGANFGGASDTHRPGSCSLSGGLRPGWEERAGGCLRRSVAARHVTKGDQKAFPSLPIQPLSSFTSTLSPPLSLFSFPLTPGKAKARLSTLERAIVTWLVVTAAVHLVVEGESRAWSRALRLGTAPPLGGRPRGRARGRVRVAPPILSLSSPLLSSHASPLSLLLSPPPFRLRRLRARLLQAGRLHGRRLCVWGVGGGERASERDEEGERENGHASLPLHPPSRPLLSFSLFFSLPSHSLPIPPNPPPSPGKEYAKADSRYAARDAFTIVMEGVTAFFVGPLCLAAAWAYTAAAPWRHLAALVASVCQLYGDALYFGTAAFDGMAHTRGEPLYFWFYFVVLNGVWVVLPGVVAWHAGREIVGACGGGGAGVGGSRRRR